MTVRTGEGHLSVAVPSSGAGRATTIVRPGKTLAASVSLVGIGEVDHTEIGLGEVGPSLGLAAVGERVPTRQAVLLNLKLGGTPISYDAQGGG